MATRFELLLEACGDGDGEGDGARLRAAGEAALEEIEEADRRLSRFRPDSVTAHVNRSLSAGESARVDDEFSELLELCDLVHRTSHGAFDAAGGAWAHFRSRFLLSEGSASCDTPEPQLDFGAIGKGFALDRAAEALREAGVERAFLHGGTSTAIAIGSPRGRSAFGLAIESERRDAKPLQVSIADGAISVSTRDQRTPDGEVHRHIIDPRANEQRLLSSDAPTVAAVRAPSAVLADAWSTAVLVLGFLPEPARTAGVELVLLESSTPSSQLRKAPIHR